MKGIFLAHVIRMQYLNWRACMDGDVCKLNCDDFTKVIMCDEGLHYQLLVY